MRLHVSNSSSRAMLSPDMYDLGHIVVATPLRAHTALCGVVSAAGVRPQRRLISSPLVLHSSHLHAAGLEN